MKTAVSIFLVVGFSLLIGLITFYGLERVIAALVSSGWGLFALCLFHLIPMVAAANCWGRLIPAMNRPSFWTVFVLQWVGGSVNSLLPVAQVGGDFVRARLLTLRGVSNALSGASVIVDITFAVGAQLFYAGGGILLLTQYDKLNDTAIAAGIGIIILGILITVFYIAQRAGLFLKLTQLLEKTVKVGDWSTITEGARILDEAIQSIYRRRTDIVIAALWRIFGVVVGTGQIIIGLHFLGYNVGVFEALILESMVHAIRNAAFMVPAAIGVQEGGLVLVGMIVGIGPDIALALSLLIRARSIVIGIPALIYWQLIESRRLIAWINRGVKASADTENPES